MVLYIVTIILMFFALARVSALFLALLLGLLAPGSFAHRL